jgi:TPR repeat protein
MLELDKRFRLEKYIETGDLYFYHEDGFDFDAIAAASWYFRAAIEGHCGAQLQLGIIYRYGAYGVSKDPIIAEFWLHNAAIQGHILANRYLSEMRTEHFDF